MYQFAGFSQADFDIFLIPEFHDRMTAVRTHIRPKLAMIGEDLAPKLTDLLHQPIFPHTASHARRRVNPPDDTWVSFSRNERGYKRFAHFEVGITLNFVFVRFVVKREGEDDKPTLMHYLRSKGTDVFQISDPAPIYWYKDDHGVDPFPITQVTNAKMVDIIQHTAVKSHGFTVGLNLDRSDPIVSSAGMITRAYNIIAHLSPLYMGTVTQAALSQ